MTSVPKMACFHLRKIGFFIDLRMPFYVKHNRCELIADHCKKGPLSMFVFFAVYININIFKCIQIAQNT